MIVKSIMTKENVEKCLSYVDKEYRSSFLELMQNIEILVSESPVQEGQPNNEKIIVGHTYKITILRTDFKSRSAYSFSYFDHNALVLKTEPDLCKILSSIRTAYKKNDSHSLRQIFTDAETAVLPLINV
jgi:hypothetical protein